MFRLVRAECASRIAEIVGIWLRFRDEFPAIECAEMSSTRPGDATRPASPLALGLTSERRYTLRASTQFPSPAPPSAKATVVSAE